MYKNSLNFYLKLNMQKITIKIDIVNLLLKAKTHSLWESI